MDHFYLTLQPIRDVAGRVTFREGCAHEALRVVPIPMSGILTRWNIKETAVTDDRFVLHDLGAFHPCRTPTVRTRAAGDKPQRGYTPGIPGCHAEWLRGACQCRRRQMVEQPVFSIVYLGDANNLGEKSPTVPSAGARDHIRSTTRDGRYTTKWF
jgi:hypothetical protein